ncbi:MAG: potassium channel family protein [Actinomycetota bacterium]|nr:potassium channel family protein [Actinomycetota bacterium]
MVTSGTPDAADLRFRALPRRVRRRLTSLALLRAGLMATVLVVVYCVLPLDISDGVSLGFGFFVGIAVFVVVVFLQAWLIGRAEFPRLRAVESLATVVPLFLLVFAATYFIMSQGNVDSFSDPMNRTNALYYTITVFSTVGFGDITPVTNAAQIVTMIQMLGDLLVFGVVVRVLAGAVGVNLQRKSSSQEPADPGSDTGQTTS